MTTDNQTATDTQPWYQSRTIITSIVVEVAGLVNIIAKRTLITSDVSEAIVGIVLVVAPILAIYFRAKATKPVTK